MNNQNESPFSNPRFLSALILVFIFLWGWQYYVSKNYASVPVVVPKTEVSEKQPSESKPINAVNDQVGVAVKNDLKPAETVEKNFNYEDEDIKWTLTSKGMGLKAIELKKYSDREGKAISFLTGEEKANFALSIEKQNIFFEVTKKSEIEYFGLARINDKTIKRTIKYNKELKYFESETEFEAGSGDLNYSFFDLKHAPAQTSFFMPSFEKQDFLFVEVGKVKTEQISGINEGESLNKQSGPISLAAIGSQYFALAFVDKSEISPSLNMLVVGKNAYADVFYNLKNSQLNKLKQIYYIGPKQGRLLQAVDPNLPEIMDLGMFGFIAKPLLLLMKFMHELLGNWGLAIIALTIVVRLVMLPFNILSFRSSRAMQKIQPHLQAIREKYKNDPMAVNRETMALMKEHKANPLSGCLPMLIQIPIFFALWKTIGSSIEIYQQPFFGWINDLSSHDHFFVLPVLMGVTMYFQQKLTPTTMDPTQAKILNFMPILFTMFMLSLPSGLTLYNFVSALFGVTQQYFLLKSNSEKKTT